MLGQVNAGSVTYTATGSDGDGPLSASITFAPINHGIEITMTNLESGTIKRGQSISGLSFAVSGSLNTPTGFTKITGDSVNSAAFTPGQPFPGSATVSPISDTGSGTIDHWRFSTNGSSVTLASAGTGAPPHNPTHMVLPSSGITGPAHSLSDSHFDRYLLGPGNFFLTAPGVTLTTDLNAGNIFSVKIRFGTNPDAILAGTAVPEPSSVVMGLIGLVGAIAMVRRRRRRA
jgi:hypothetical protein